MRTHLYEYHSSHGYLTDFAGFEIPLWYEGILPEHMAVRNSAGLFDVTHMGRCLVRGERAAEFLDYVTSRDPSRLNQLQGQYTLLCNDSGGIEDDLTVFRLNPTEYLLVYNASNREKDQKWLREHSDGFNVQIEDVSDDTPMFALQGPKAQEVLQKLISIDLAAIRRFWLAFTDYRGIKLSISRSGYTGEDGFEICVWGTPLSRPQNAVDLWNHILDAGRNLVSPCGLGARDTLRLEAGMCLYGSDITDTTTPFEAKLDFTVKMDKPRFIGREALLELMQKGIRRVRVGLKMRGHAIPRRGFSVLIGDRKIGEVTSGTYSPLLQRGIAMAYVDVEYASIGNIFNMDVRGQTVEAEVVSMPFYDTEKYGWRRKQA